MLGAPVSAVREQKRHAWRAVAARLAALGLLLLMLPLMSCICCLGGLDDEYGAALLGGILPPYLDPINFADEFANHVRAADETEDGLRAWQGKWYAKGTTIPDINETRARIKLPEGENLTTSDSPLRNVNVVLNVEWYAEVGLDFEGTLFERVSPEGHMPVLKLMDAPGLSHEGGEAPGEEAQPASEYPVEYRHTISIGMDQLLLTFELWGTDPQTGQPAGERHTVKLRSFALLGLEDTDVERRGVDAPCFLVTSHTIEALPPQQGE